MKVAALFWLLPAFVAAQSPTQTLSPWQTGMVTEDGTCGGDTGFVCSPIWGACCSKDGQCGRSSKFCGEGCQSKAGNCNAAAPPPEVPLGPGSVSPDGSCGGTNKFVCGGSAFGDCCSTQGWCGNSTAHCGNNCAPDFGTCGPPSNITFDGQCGANGKICLDSGYGDCCSVGGWCGDKAEHCGAGCQKGFGNCTLTDAGDISTDGFCGKNGKTCKGSSFGDCCSKEGYCGKESHCDAGCQSKFGSCNAETDISTDGFCGKNGKTCKGSTYGDCCSKEGYCGKEGHCGAGCQTAFGTCKADSGTVSTDGRCGSFNGKTCKGSTYGDCCSVGGWCGDKKDHCDAGCQSKFGTCNSEASNISTDGFCGKNGKTCKGSTYGDCCSAEGYCGKEGHCKAGCQTKFGTCDESSSNVSTDGFCGKNGKTCKGSTYGDCCSAEGYCGKEGHCKAGCQTKFGTCDAASSNVSTDGSCGKNGKTCKGSSYGDCCSEYGYCGKGDTFCRNGCQKAFGLCTGISSDSECGTRNGKTCAGSGLGNCCSSNGYCGSTASHCGQGCQKGASSACLTKDIPSLDSTCGSKVGLTCAGGPFNGQCCGSTGFCGTTSTHCGANCQKGFGRCN